MIVPEYIEVRNIVGQPTAFLSPEADKIRECWLSNRLNEECTLEFMLPMTSPKWQELDAECKVIAGGREFIILKPESVDVSRDDQGKMWGKLMATESWKLLDKDYVTVSNDPQTPEPPDLAVIILSGGPSTGGYAQGSAGSALSYLLDESEWELEFCDVTGTHDLETEKESLLANIKEVQNKWGGYLVWDSLNKKVSLHAEETWQEYRGFQVRYAKNLKHITRTANNDLITRLYPFGENDLDISSVNGGLKYIDNFDYTETVYTGVYIDQSIRDPQELKDKATEALEKLSKPRYTYRIKIADVRVMPEYSHEYFQEGDIADVVDSVLSFDIRARIVRHKYNIFMPWRCELDIGEPEDRLAARLSDTLDVARFVREALRPNPATSNLLKGFIDTFATRINSANGMLVWDDATLQAIEIDGEGDETGNRVRITPGGVGISTDGGQTFVVAMTGEGILANTIIVNELYALATDDGYTKLTASGLRVYDETLAERLIAGWWMDGQTKRFGLNVKAEDGSTTLLDDRGLLQTWQEGRADNVQGTGGSPFLYPLVLNVYLPAETRSIRRALLRFRLQNFRAYSTGAASGGGHTTASGGGHTTASGGGHTTPSGGGHSSGAYGTLLTSTTIGNRYYLYATFVPDYTSESGNHNHGGNTGYAGGHNHGLTNHTHANVNNTPSGSHYDNHRHAIGNSGTHPHGLTTEHYHSVTLPDHTHAVNNHIHSVSNHTHTVSDHTHTVSDHTHPIAYGIYVSTSAANINLKINGVDRTSVLGGPFTSDQVNLDISSYLATGQWNVIELGSTALGRIESAVFIQALMGI